MIKNSSPLPHLDNKPLLLCDCNATQLWIVQLQSSTAKFFKQVMCNTLKFVGTMLGLRSKGSPCPSISKRLNQNLKKRKKKEKCQFGFCYLPLNTRVKKKKKNHIALFALMNQRHSRHDNFDAEATRSKSRKPQSLKMLPSAGLIQVMHLNIKCKTGNEKQNHFINLFFY